MLKQSCKDLERWSGCGYLQRWSRRRPPSGAKGGAVASGAGPLAASTAAAAEASELQGTSIVGSPARGGGARGTTRAAGGEGRFLFVFSIGAGIDELKHKINYVCLYDDGFHKDIK